MNKTAIAAISALIVGALIGGFLVGVVKDKAVAAVQAELASANLANEVAAHRERLGAIAIEASRMNFGTARDEMVLLLGDLTTLEAKVKGTEHEAAVQAMLENRDQIVSELSVGSPVATEMLQRMYLDLGK
jgi:hypothetical protein